MTSKMWKCYQSFGSITLLTSVNHQRQCLLRLEVYQIAIAYIWSRATIT